MSGLPAGHVDVGWQARLELQFQRARGRTRLSRRAHHGPLLVQRAFYPEPPANTDLFAAEPCHVYVIHPPGGVVSGDELSLEIEVQAQAHALLTTPSAGKFYRRVGQRVTRLSQTLRVDGGVLEWLPQENIFYPQSTAKLQTHVALSGGARFLGWELSCFGFPASCVSLEEGNIHLDFELWHERRPLLLERLRLDAASHVFWERWGLAGNYTMGTMLAFPCRREHLDSAREAVLQSEFTACSLVEGVLICRALHAQAEDIKRIFVQIWRRLRPMMLGRQAHAPRIWTT